MKEENLNILDIDKGIICHQVNCQGVMGKGLASQIKKKYPIVFQQYRLNPKVLGTIDVVKVSDNLFVCNMFAQDTYGYNKVYTDYKAFEQCLINLSTITKVVKLPVYFPYKIGCGLGGGNWEIIKALTDLHFPDATLCKIED